MVDWDLLDEDWNSLGSWTLHGTGTSAINPAGQLNNIPTVVNSYVGRYKDIGTLPEAGYTVETRLCIDSFGTNGYHNFQFYDGVHYIMIDIYPTYIKEHTLGKTISVTTTAGTWYVWTLVINSTGDSIAVYRDDVGYIGDLGPCFDGTLNDGYVYASFMFNGNPIGAQSHQDYMRIATGLFPPMNNLEREITEFLGSLDSKTKFSTRTKTFTELFGFYDILGKIKNMYKSFIDYIGSIDTVSTLIGYVKYIFRTITEYFGMEESKLKVHGIFKTIVDSLGSSDSVSKFKNAFKSLIDYIGSLDTQSTVRTMYRNITEYLGYVDNLFREVWNAILKVWTKVPVVLSTSKVLGTSPVVLQTKKVIRWVKHIIQKEEE